MFIHIEAALVFTLHSGGQPPQVIAISNEERDLLWELFLCKASKEVVASWMARHWMLDASDAHDLLAECYALWMQNYPTPAKPKKDWGYALEA